MLDSRAKVQKIQGEPGISVHVKKQGRAQKDTHKKSLVHVKRKKQNLA